MKNIIIDGKEYSLTLVNEVVEKDYEILSLIEGKFIYPCDKYGEDFINQLFNTLGVSIHSVKRLSDGEVFTIGDIVNAFNNISHNYPIVRIRLHPEENTVLLGAYVKIHSSGRYNARLKDLVKVKKPLFKTEDGIDLFEGDIYHTVNPLFIYAGYHRITSAKTPDRSNHWECNRNVLRYFSTKEAAKEYIFMNKPCLSLKDVASIYISADKPITDTTSFSAQNRRIQDLVKSKIQQPV